MRSERVRQVSEDVQRTAGYRGKPFPQTHPDRLATVARLHGIPAAAPERCRVLELGCGDGGNLIPMAFELRGSTFIGIDLDAERIEQGRNLTLKLTLDNVELAARDISEVNDEYGKFDYIIAHGVYCWVPQKVRTHLLDLCRRLLSDGGVAFVSFNVLPGWHFLEYMRDFALLAAELDESSEEPLARIRRLAKVFADGLGGLGPQSEHLKALFGQLHSASDYLLAFDYLGGVSEPLSFGDFLSDAEANGLRYIADANFFETELQRIPAAVRGVLNKQVAEPLSRERLADFFGARLFRRALLCKASQPCTLRGAVAVRDAEILARVTHLTPGDDATKPTEASFAMLHQAKLRISSPIVKQGLTRLGAAWPQSIGFSTLVEQVAKQDRNGAERAEVERILTEALWELYGAGGIDLRCSAPRCAMRAAERPVASAMARLRLGEDGETVNQHHEPVRFTDNFSRTLFQMLDGTKDRRELADRLLTLSNSGELELSAGERDALPAAIEQRLATWAAHALLLDSAEAT